MEPDGVDGLLERGLDAIDVSAPIDDGLAAVRVRQRRTQVRHRALAGLAAGVLTISGIAIAADVLDDEPQGVSTDPGPSTTASTSPSETTTSGLPGPQGAVALDPPGPYRDGDKVNLGLVGFGPADASNDLPRLCATIEAVETCDPLWLGGHFNTSTLRQITFTPSGWRDCAEPAVDCRIVVNGNDGQPHRSERLRFEGDAPPPDVGLEVDAPGGGDLVNDVAVLRPSALAPDPTWDEWEAELEANGNDLTAFNVQVCSFGQPQSHYQCDLLSYFVSINPDRPNDPIELPVAREIFGFDGWHDCVESACFVLISATEVQSVTAEGTYASGGPVAAAPIRFDPEKNARPRPVLSISGGPEVAVGDEIEVHIENVPVLHNETMDLSVCHQDPTARNDCSYLTYADDGPIAVDETVPVTFGLAWPVDYCERDGCFLALTIGQEGAGPLATLPLEVSP